MLLLCLSLATQPPSKLLSKQKLPAQWPSQVSNLHCQPHPLRLSKNKDKNRRLRMTLLRSLKKSLEDYEAEAIAALQNKKVPNNTKSKAFKRPAAAISKQKAQPTKMEPKAGGAAAAKGCKRQKQNHPSQSKSKLVIWASMVARGAEATLKDVTNVGRRATKLKGSLGGSTAYFWAAINPSSLTGVSSWEAWLVQLGCVSKCWARKASQKNCCSFQW